MNSVALTGWLTRGPELTYAQSGTAVAKFGLAVDRQFKREGGQEADFFECVAFGKTGEVATQYLDKGAQVGVTGRVEIDRVEKDGQTRYYTKVVVETVTFLESRADAEARRGTPPATPQPVDDDDEDPFADQ